MTSRDLPPQLDEVFARFNLSSTAVLEDPQCDDTPSDELVEALGVLHHENPARSSAMPLESSLSHADALEPQTTYGLLNAIQD